MCPCAPICILFLSRRRKSTRKLFMRVLLYERQKKKKKKDKRQKIKHIYEYNLFIRLDIYLGLG